MKLLKLAKMEDIVEAAFLVINGNRPKQKLQLLESLKRRCDSDKYNFLERLLGVTRLLSQIVEPMLKASMQISTLLAQSFFMKFSLTTLAVLARMRVLVQQILLDAVYVYNAVSALSQKEQTVKLNQEGFEVGLCSTIDLTPSTSLIFGTTKDGTENRWRSKAMLSHMLPDHDATLDAALPELFIDGKGNYWEVPLSVSLDCSSPVSESGLRYRFGIHKNSGLPQADNSTNGESPVALLPGLCAKAAVSFEKSKDLWRKENDTSDLRNSQCRIPYDVRMWDPHSAISGIIGATSEAWFGSGKGSGPDAFRANDKFRLGADLFGSACFTYQHGKFCDYFGDLTRIDARLDMSSASALVKKVYDLARSEQSSQSCNLRASPRLNLMFQQQVCGPIVFRVDSKFGLDSFAKNRPPQLEDLIYSLNYSLRVLGSGKVVAWYSPKRKQGMVELGTFEF